MTKSATFQLVVVLHVVLVVVRDPKDAGLDLYNVVLVVVVVVLAQVIQVVLQCLEQRRKLRSQVVSLYVSARVLHERE